MEVGARQFASHVAGAFGAPFVAADVGGTHARIGLVQPYASARPALERYEKYVCADYPGLSAILREFLGSLGGASVHEAAIACAGYCLDGTIINTNLPWTVSLDRIRADLNLSAVEFVNDFEAVAYATPQIDLHDTTLLTRASEAQVSAPTVIVGPGTGLGASVRIPTNGGHLVLATEAGQSAFAPSTDREIEVLRLLRRKSSHVSIESVLSGPGLVNLHAALGELSGSGTPQRSTRRPTSPVRHSMHPIRWRVTRW